MKKSYKKMIKILIIYFIASSLFIFVHIDNSTPTYYENYTIDNGIKNTIRLIMGIPKISGGYEGISHKYIFEIILKVLLATGLIIVLLIDKKNTKKEVEKNILRNITKLIFSCIFISMYLLYLYIIYCNIHCIR